MSCYSKLANSVLSLAFIMLFLTSIASCGRNEIQPHPELGISLDLASERVRTIKNLRYELAFDIPRTESDLIKGRAVIRFILTEKSNDLVLDFAHGVENVTYLSVDDSPAEYTAVNDHLVIPIQFLAIGENIIKITFLTNNTAFNRNPYFMYTLFVPARAHLAFPCFDQPDMKARLSLELSVPADWEAVANGREVARKKDGDKLLLRFAETQPIPTYLFAFAAGKFKVETAERNGRTFRMLHRETDSEKLERNRDTLFDLHSLSLDWLEGYSAIDYQFGKFDFILIPSFQFGGMEHPGAIFYSASRLLLDESATQKDLLERAMLIAHETAHMWFGNLVTMRWFNDVWMKEVFANFIAAKIMNPAFPQINHDLHFLVANYPSAYSVDRTEGTHPIRQRLKNLRDAGNLYGAIIYQKAPIVMRQLERMLGTKVLQEGLRIYLKQFALGNAAWIDLVRVLDNKTELDLSEWSRRWIEEEGRPLIRAEMELDSRGTLHSLTIAQSDPKDGRSASWTQQVDVLLGKAGGGETIPLVLKNGLSQLDVSTITDLDFVLPNGSGLAYGGIELDDRSRQYLLEHLGGIADPVNRGAAWITLWEELLDGRVKALEFLETAIRVLPSEDSEQNTSLLLGYIGQAFWRFLTSEERQALSVDIERSFRRGLQGANSSSLKSSYFSAFRSIVTTREGINFLKRVWQRNANIPGIVLSENDEIAMAFDLAVRSVPEANEILQEQLSRIENPDRKRRYKFVMPALSGSQEIRDAFFESMLNYENRRHEPWVLEGLRYLHHPLRSEYSMKYLRTSLDLVEELQLTGDVFFPRNWLNVILGGHESAAAAEIVREFLREKRDCPVQCQRIILQSADLLFRSVKIREKH